MKPHFKNKKVKINIKYTGCKPDTTKYCECKKEEIFPIVTTNNYLICMNCIREIHPENFDWNTLKEVW